MDQNSRRQNFDGDGAGAWNAIPAWLRFASRDIEVPSLRSNSFGFRVARTD